MQPDVKTRNLRTGLILLAIALVFFFGVIAAQFLGSPVASIAVVGLAVLLFLVLGIGRHLRR